MANTMKSRRSMVVCPGSYRWVDDRVEGVCRECGRLCAVYDNGKLWRHSPRKPNDIDWRGR